MAKRVITQSRKAAKNWLTQSRKAAKAQRISSRKADLTQSRKAAKGKDSNERNIMRRYNRRQRQVLTENEIAREIVNAAYKIHKAYGPGLLESAYQAMMIYELRKQGLYVADEVDIPLIYDGVDLNKRAYRADIIVNNVVIIELKSVEKVAPVHKKQLLTYLRLANKRLGLLINFGAPLIKKGITRGRRFKLRKDYLTLMKKKLYEQFGVRGWGFGVRGLASSCSSQTGLKWTEKTLKTSL